MMSHAPRAWWLETKSYALRKPRHRLASLRTPKKIFSVVFCCGRGGGGCGHFFLLLAGKKWRGVEGGGKLFARSPELGDGFLDTQPKLTKPLTRGGGIC